MASAAAEDFPAFPERYHSTATASARMMQIEDEFETASGIWKIPREFPHPIFGRQGHGHILTVPGDVRGYVPENIIHRF